eukprot:UN31772
MTSKPRKQDENLSILQQLSDVENCTLGLAAGFIAKSINYPLLYWKNSCQQGLPFTANPRFIYRGISMAMVNLGGTTALQFGLAGFFQKLIVGQEKRKLSMGEEITAAFSGGFVSGIPCCLWEMTMIQQQRFGGTIIGTPLRIVKDYGVLSLFRGVVATCGRESFFTMGMLGICPVLTELLVEQHDMSKPAALALGSLSGAIMAACLTHPLDTIKHVCRVILVKKIYNAKSDTHNATRTI